MKFVLGLMTCLFLLSAAAFAQPYSVFLNIPSGHGYAAIPASSDFDFTTAFTFEAWVQVSDSGACSSIAGKGYTTAWWVGVCGTTLRSYIKGSSSLFDGGTIPANVWTHIAVVYDGVTRKHYIDGEEVASRADTAPMTTNTNEVRIGSDVAYAFSAKGYMDEVRLWNVARTKDQLRSTITAQISSPTPGLVAAYHFENTIVDSAGGHNGTLNGTGSYLVYSAGGACTPDPHQLCFDGNRILVFVRWIAPDGTSGLGNVVPGGSANSGLFWFFGADNWELLIKHINACSLNSRRWIFSAATTNVHYNVTVINTLNGQEKHYFNFQGINAAAVNDTGAFATCP